MQLRMFKAGEPGEGDIVVQSATYVTRLVSFVDEPQRPARLLLNEDQEVVSEERAAVLGFERVQRFLYVRGPAHLPVRFMRQEALEDGSRLWVRHEPELDICVPAAS